ncbi:MAG: hypothetical protein IPJ19_18720 [Planctomycetes bacterium]|nr:hypothetical protein [Planctomycetota bacterium]
MHLTLLALALSLPQPLSVSASGIPPGLLPYEKIAREYAASIGLGSAAPEEILYEDVLAKHFLHLRLGAFDLHFPVAEMDRRSEEFRSCSIAVVDAQLKWLDWLQVSQPEARVLREDLKALGAWIKGSKWPTPASGAATEPQDALQLFHAPEAILQAGGRAAEVLASGRLLGPPRDEPLCQGIVILPSRKLFTEFVYFVGWIQPDDSELFWQDAVRDWGQCIFGEDMAVTLEYPSANRAADDYASSTPMNERGANVLQQQFVQIAMLSLFKHFCGERAPPAFLGGLSTNLVIDLFGEVNTRVDGDLRGKVTEAIEVFVPGGASSGGVLAKNSADSRWREKQGADYFLPTLRASQKEGATLQKGVKNRLACFCIRSDSEAEKQLVAAPFLGAAAAKMAAPPAQFQGDFAELIRSYKSCFICWLQTKGKSGEKASREAFAALLRNLADPGRTDEFEQVFQVAYGAPLSNADADKSSLEGQFLLWLSHQK